MNLKNVNKSVNSILATGLSDAFSYAFVRLSHIQSTPPFRNSKLNFVLK